MVGVPCSHRGHYIGCPRCLIYLASEKSFDVFHTAKGGGKKNGATPEGLRRVCNAGLLARKPQLCGSPSNARILGVVATERAHENGAADSPNHLSVADYSKPFYPSFDH